MFAEILTKWLNGSKNTWELNEGESKIFELFSADAYENFAESIPSFKILFMPKKVKFNPSEIVFTNLYVATYHEEIDISREKYKSSENNLRIHFKNKCYLFTVNDSYLYVLNENDTEDLCRKTFYLPFIERIWILKDRILFVSIPKELKILYHNKEEKILDLGGAFDSMSEDDINKLIDFFIRHQPRLEVGYKF
jgi:hypothetical protein